MRSSVLFDKLVEPPVLLPTVRAGWFWIKGMTIGNWLKLARKKIAALDAELILLFGLRDMLPKGADRSYIFAHPEVGISQESWENLDKMVERRAKGEPLAYILGVKEFYGREFRVDSGVLIPRPETESLVDLALEVVGGSKSDALEKVRSEGGFSEKGLEWAAGWQILEIGTGSGCIATTLSLEMAVRGISGAVTATDMSEVALERARENAARLEASVRFLWSDLLSEVPRLEDFEVLVANLPYVDRNWGWLDFSGLDFEPALALYAEEKGLALYRRLLEELKGRVKWVIFEADPCQHEELVELAERNGYRLDKIEGFGLRFRK